MKISGIIALLTLLFCARLAPAQVSLVNAGHLTDFTSGLTIVSNRLYLTKDTGGIHTYNLSNPANPVSLGDSTNNPATATCLAISGRYAYVGGSSSIYAYDVSDPANIATLGHTNLTIGVIGLVATSNCLYAIDTISTLSTYDISNPANINFITKTNTGGIPRQIITSKHYLYLANSKDGLRIYDISTPTNPVSIGNFAPSNSAAYSVALYGNYALVANGTTIAIGDVSNPTNPVSVLTTNIGAFSSQIAVCRHAAYIGSGQIPFVTAFDLGYLPNRLVKAGQASANGAYNKFVINGPHLYLGNGADGLRIFALRPLLRAYLDIPGSIDFVWTDAAAFYLEEATNFTGATWADPGDFIGVGTASTALHRPATNMFYRLHAFDYPAWGAWSSETP